jgi:hypothetical protein
MAFYLKAALAALALAGGGLAQAAPVPAPGTVTGPQTIRPASDEFLEWAASVVRVDMLGDQSPREIAGPGEATAKLFGAAGGDPAMNGLNTYLAFFASPQDGWIVFPIGDFLDYRIVSQAARRVTLEVDESVMNQVSGEIGSRTRRFNVTWTAPPEEAPASVTVTPAG